MALAFVTQTTRQMRPVNFIIQQDSHGFGNVLGIVDSVNQVQKNLSGMLKIVFCEEHSGTSYHHQAAIITHASPSQFTLYSSKLHPPLLMYVYSLVVRRANHIYPALGVMQFKGSSEIVIVT